MVTDIRKIREAMADEAWKEWWSPAVNRAPTFEEAFFAYVFILNGFDVEREYVVGKYPIDFAVPEAKLAMEIDAPCCRGRGGRNSKKRKADAKREFLTELGWNVHQIRWWRKPFDVNKKHTQQEINRVLCLVRDAHG